MPGSNGQTPNIDDINESAIANYKNEQFFGALELPDQSFVSIDHIGLQQECR